MKEIVIELSDLEYNQLIYGDDGLDYEVLEQAVVNGTPLPKGHGRLKDIDKIINDGRAKGFCDWYDEMKYADTIIEADEVESEE